jgi:glycosyltransferase involved in cell wall biosynthesis
MSGTLYARLRDRAITVTLVVPVFNESSAIVLFLQRVKAVFDAAPRLKGEVLFINDGSTDDTLDLIIEQQKNFAPLAIQAIDLSRNFGKEAALAAGLAEAAGDVVIPIDVDLQDPPELIPVMIEQWEKGYDVVLARRVDRSRDPLMKRLTADWFYRLHNAISDPPLPANVGDFRAMDRAVVEVINALPETQRFMKGLFAWVGFRSCMVDYSRPERSAGQSKFNSWKLWNFALEGITSFSAAPLRMWTYLGGLISLASFIFAATIVVRVWVYGVDVPGYASLMVAVTFFGGIQLIGIGALGEYLARTYMESKRRPLYVIRRRYPDPSP